MATKNAQNQLLAKELTELNEGLQIIELEERFEMVQLTAVVSSYKEAPTVASDRCDLGSVISK